MSIIMAGLAFTIIRTFPSFVVGLIVKPGFLKKRVTILVFIYNLRNFNIIFIEA